MTLRLAALFALVLLLTLGIGSAASLDVNGGSLQAFEIAVRFPTATAPPTDTPTATPTATEQLATPTNTEQPAGPTDTPTPQEMGQAGTSLEADITAVTPAEAVETGGYVVTGQVCAANTGERATENLSITLVVQIKLRQDKFADLPDSTLTLPLPQPLAPGETGCYAYAVSFAPPTAWAYRIVARVTITNHSGWLPGGPHCPGPASCAFGPEPKATFQLPEWNEGAEVQLNLSTPTTVPSSTATAPPTTSPLPSETYISAATDTSVPATSLLEQPPAIATQTATVEPEPF